MPVTQLQVDSLKEDVRALGDSVSEILVRVAAHDERFTKIDRRLEHIDDRIEHIDGRIGQIDGRLEHIDSALGQILTLVRQQP